MIDLRTLSITQARKDLDEKKYSAVALAEAALAVIAERDAIVGAFLEVYSDVLEQAAHADSMIAAGDIHPLTGIPIALKDNILRKGSRATASSKILEGYVASYSATVVDTLTKQGAVLVGRTNCDEFAMGSSTENSAYKKTTNPRDSKRVPGGSSGGSAAAVAAGMVLGSYGSDTGGSIRQPASFCGVVGLKPTYGSVSRYGLIAMGSSLDVIGPFGKSVEDTRILFDAVRGRDAMDHTSIPDYVSPAVATEGRPLTIGVPRAFVEKGLSHDASKVFEDALNALKAKGHTIIDIELPAVPKSLAVYYIIMPAEVSTNLSRFDGIRYGLHIEGKDGIDDFIQTRTKGFGNEVRRRILLGAYVLSSGYYDAYYAKAVAIRNQIKKEFADAFAKVDVIATPTTPGPAFVFGEKTNDPLSMYLEDIFTVPANIAGIPGISVPSGEVIVEGVALPLGIQFLAAHTNESHLFAVAKDIGA